MLMIEEVSAVLREEFIPQATKGADPTELEKFMVQRWGATDEVFELLQIVVKSEAQFAMDEFEKLPQSIRERLARSNYPLDERAVLDHYTLMGADSTLKLISNMEAVAKKVSEEAFWKDLGKTPFAQFANRPQSYAENVSSRWKAGVEAVRKLNAA